MTNHWCIASVSWGNDSISMLYKLVLDGYKPEKQQECDDR